VEKRSELLGRNAVWSRVSRVVSLPKYLCVHFLRFYWKATPDSRDHAGVKCKMLRPVTFPADNFDVYEFCTARLQHKLRALRAKHGDAVPAAPKALADASSAAGASSSSSAAAGPGSAAATTSAAAPSAAAAPSTTAMDEDDDLAAALRMSMDGAAATSAGANSSSMAVDGAKPAAAASASSSAVSPSGEPIGYGVPESFRGFYELFAIVTHKGRSADSGHYIAWVRRTATGSTVPGDKDKWLVFDDDSISEVTTDFVVGMLKGGGDEHMAYLTFYRAKA
jgi:ubiquitin carboxyl-terminal hydrolase 14